MVYKLNFKMSCVLLFSIFIVSFSFSQEKRCIPEVWSGEVVKGYVILENGDSLQGKFTHLTPYNDIKTTHVIYDKAKQKKVYINRRDVKLYYDKKKKESRLRVYINKDSTHIKKNCFFDQGRFLVIVEKGRYMLVKDELHYHSSISAYSQSSSDNIYYLLLPNANLVKVNISDLKAQMKSIFMNEKSIENYNISDDFYIEDMISLLHYVNEN